jgi:hypothetical protein
LRDLAMMIVSMHGPSYRDDFLVIEYRPQRGDAPHGLDIWQRDDVGNEDARLPADHIRFAAAVQFCCLITSREGALDRFPISRIGSIDQLTRRRQSGAPL